MIRFRSFVLPAIATLCGACGQKGDLYMPQQREPVATVPSGASNAGATGAAGAVANPQPREDEDTQAVRPPATGNGTLPPAGTN